MLGSCVAACIRDPIRGSAGMNHFMLPQHDHLDAAAAPETSLRYGLYAMESLINEFIKHGSRRGDLEAKVFGGAAVMTFSHGNVGQLNASFVLEYLATEGIATTAADLGGVLPRKLLQFVDTGIVRVKYLSPLNNDTIQRQETAYARELLRPQAGAANIELFG